MGLSVLSAKLHPPPSPEQMLPRGELLNGSRFADVILVSAQAGSGKSTVVSAWLSGQERPFCWYLLDSWDNDLLQFFTYLAEGIRKIDEQTSQALAQLLEAWQLLGYEAFLRALIHQLHAIQKPYILVLDDYHAISSDQVHQALRTLLEHFPPRMQLVIITREDPPLPLARMRASRRLMEVRIAQLRFSDAETRAHFARNLPFTLTEVQLQKLIRRTEGWIAGIQMAVLAMQGLENIDGFIDAFSGSHHYVMDYLMEEVLQRHTPEVRDFLLQSSLLDSFSAELCDSILQVQPGNSGAVIQKLVSTNSFVIPLDSIQRWYRYHHLFRELLRQRMANQPESLLRSLHYRAGAWYRENGRMNEAVHHLLQAKATTEAAALIECKWNEMDMRLQSASWLDMAKELPREIIERSPVLAMGFGWALLDQGDVDTCREWLEKAQNLLAICQSSPRPEGVLVADETQFALLTATIASAYAYIAAATGDTANTFAYARYALDHTPEDYHAKRSVIEMLLGLAFWKSGDLHEAEAVILRLSGNARRTANPIIEFSFYLVLGELYIQQGNLQKAKDILEQTIARLDEGGPAAIMLPSLRLGLAKVAFMQGDLEQAQALLERSKAQGQQYAPMDWTYKYFLLLARLSLAEGLPDMARSYLGESRAHFRLNPIPDDVSLDDVEQAIALATARQQPSPLSGDKNEMSQVQLRDQANRRLPDPLTSRELEVLSLIVSGQSNQEICDSLFLALSTVKGYNQNIFEKLGVGRRTQAILKARELGLA